MQNAIIYMVFVVAVAVFYLVSTLVIIKRLEKKQQKTHELVNGLFFILAGKADGYLSRKVDKDGDYIRTMRVEYRDDANGEFSTKFWSCDSTPQNF